MRSLWWRGEQFYRLALKSLIAAKSATPPNSQDAQNYAHPYNVAVYGFLVNVGLMGHFLGDATEPHHVTADYDGYGTGHGGIHSFYETQVVNSLDLDFAGKVAAEARRILAATTSDSFVIEAQASALERFKQATVETSADIARVEALDVVLEPSTTSTNEAGQIVKKPAKRSPAASVALKFEPLIIHETARAAILLAQLLDEMQRTAGGANLSAYRSYRYPVAPEFVAPDYVTTVANP
jgi:hypothetical protein